MSTGEGGRPAGADRPAASAAWTAALLYAAALSILFAAAYEWRVYAQLVDWHDARLSLADRATLGWLLAAKSLALLTPALAACGLLIWAGWRRTAAVVLFAGCVLVFFLLTVDLQLQRNAGSHLSDYLPFAIDIVLDPRARHEQWAGGLDQAAIEAVLLLLAMAAAGGLLFALAARLGRRVSRRLDVRLTAVALLAFMAGVVPALGRFEQPAALRRLVMALPVDAVPAVKLGESLGRAWRRPSSSLAIVALLPDPWGEDAGREKVVIHNRSATAAELAGWSLEVAGGSHRLAGRIPGDSSHTLVLPAEAPPLPNEDGVVRLVDGHGHIQDEVRYRWAAQGLFLSFSRRELYDRFESRINRGVSAVYRQAFSELTRVKPLVEGIGRKLDAPPHVVLIVLESFRLDALSPEVMPRLDAWADRGLRLDRHYAGSNCSHWGFFGLLYGRLPALFDATLAAGIPPQLTTTMRELGYRSSFISAGEWRGFRLMSRFINTDNFDAAWVEGEMAARPDSANEADSLALAAVRRTLETAGDESQFVVSYLMSTHFPYQFPPRHAIHRPTGGDELRFSNWSRLPPDQLWNRYRNAAGYLEGRLMDLIDGLDAERTVVIVTGDHGESMFEDGALAHCTRPSDVQMQVPFVMVGPGVAARRVEHATWHGDLIPTLVHVLTGEPAAVPHVYGHDLAAGAPAAGAPAAGAPAADQLLVAPIKAWEPRELVLVRGDERLLFQARLDRAAIELVGALDARGRLELGPGRSFLDPELWIDAFREELERSSR